ncbi:MAG TPA: alpha/beta hydrolase [Solirubrobacterales bacterium]|nr:alpha/beta hydrolase [Solirubrobacterales bacterium]
MPPQTLTRAGTDLALWDFGGEGPAALLVHGLAGHAGEWAETATWLRETRHVFALDLRGHGHSEPRPTDVSPKALRDDVCFALDQIGAPTLLLGQSLGGRVVILAAAARPELVECLVVAEAGPEGTADGGELKAAEMELGLEEWPVPFPDVATAEAFFEGPGAHADAWARGLRQEPDGLYPRFEVEVLGRMIQAAVADDCWADWSRIACPTLVVRGGASGQLPSEEVSLMLTELSGAQCAELPGAAHELHLEEPDLWRATVVEFLDQLPRR